jgi:hypothetical protein
MGAAWAWRLLQLQPARPWEPTAHTQAPVTGHQSRVARCITLVVVRVAPYTTIRANDLVPTTGLHVSVLLLLRVYYFARTIAGMYAAHD